MEKRQKNRNKKMHSIVLEHIFSATYSIIYINNMKYCESCRRKEYHNLLKGYEMYSICDFIYFVFFPMFIPLQTIPLFILNHVHKTLLQNLLIKRIY